MKKIVVPVGERYGQLEVLIPGEKTRDKTLFLCDCGEEKLIRLDHVRSGKIMSCGHIKIKHNMNNTRTHNTWVAIRSRCSNENDVHHKWYIDKGIRVCDRWLESFSNFLEDMGERPEGMTLDRVDNTQGYSPENCRWATPKEQANNRNNTSFLTAFGETKSLSYWTEDSRCTPTTSAGIRARLERGMNPEEALTKPLK